MLEISLSLAVYYVNITTGIRSQDKTQQLIGVIHGDEEDYTHDREFNLGKINDVGNDIFRPQQYNQFPVGKNGLY
ncbi:hypothetical protein YC2023_051920 [Brassica napus]